MRTRLSLMLLLAVFTCGLTACGDDDRAPLDGGADDANVTPDGGTDAVVDTEGPRVLRSDPTDEAPGVPTDRTLTIEMSEPVQAGGAVVASSADGTIDVDVTVGDDARFLYVTGTWPLASTVEVVVDEWEDLAGNAQVAAFSFSFDTEATNAPRVVSATPAEGATGVDSALAEARVAFDRSMDTAAGAVTLLGAGAGVVGELAWEDDTLVIPLAGLDADTAYGLSLDGFLGADGTPLATGPVLGDGVLDFTTGADETAPRVVDSSPMEGQTAVPVTLETVELRFSEPMDSSVGEATLVVDDERTVLRGTWSEGDARLSLRVPANFPYEVDVHVELVGFTDAAGNALDGAPILVDGALDFVASDDTVTPAVVLTVPAEGATGLDPILLPFEDDQISIAFNKAMDTTRSEIVLDDGARSLTLPVRWNLSGSVMLLDVEGLLYAGREHRIDLTSVVDPAGRAVSATDAYTVDGVVDFATLAPTGESCRYALQTPQATEIEAGVFQWTIAAGAVEVQNGAFRTCDSSTAPDAVMLVPKVSGDTVLRVDVEGANADEVTVEIYRHDCDPRATTANDARVVCSPPRDRGNVAFATGAAGDYFVWVAQTSGTFDGATVTVRELASAPPGESCDVPLEIGDASGFYTAPATTGDFHVWDIPGGSFVGLDRTVGDELPGQFTCDSNGTSSDGVIRFTKTSPTSVLQVDAVRTSSCSTCSPAIEVSSGPCDVRLPGSVSEACDTSVSTGASATFFDITGDAGDRWIWLGGQDIDNPEGVTGVRVSVREIEPALGDSCATAVPLVLGDNTVTADRPYDLDRPSCLDERAALTWYSFTPSEASVNVAFDVPAAVGALQGGSEIGCSDDPIVSASVFATPGSSVCFALASTAGVTRITLGEAPYDGIRGTLVDLGVDRGAQSLVADNWMAMTPTYVYLGEGDDTAVRVRRDTPMPALELFTTGFSTANVGESAVAVGERVFGLEDGTSAAVRVRQYFDETGAQNLVDWDTGSSWDGLGTRAIAYDGTDLLVATYSTSAAARVYRLDPSAPGAAVELGRNDHLTYVTGVAGDATYVYLAGRLDGDAAAEGLYRIARADLGTSTVVPELIGLFDVDTFSNPIVLHTTATSTYAYTREVGASVLAYRVSGTPRFMGIVASGFSSTIYEGLTLDPSLPALFVNDGNTVPFYRID
ncbi:MAG: Ig-like domain-containing protein [Polyangiales bacterium]